MTRSGGVIATLVLVTIAVFVGPAVRGAEAAAVVAEPVCFTVHNPGDPVASQVFGMRYRRGAVRPSTPAIVLVHGGASTHQVWDFPADYSVARRLAARGYVVIAYDQLGVGASRYDRGPGSGLRITWEGQRDVLHQVVTHVRQGTYRRPAAPNCGGTGRRAASHSSRVVLMGHSYGGYFVAGYPGKYGDIAGVVQVETSHNGISPDVATRVVVDGALEASKNPEYINIYADPEDCRRELVYEPGLEPGLLPSLCHPSNFAPHPSIQLAGSPALVATNLALITRIGPDVPVLLTFGDKSFHIPVDARGREIKYWQDTCGCDVTSWTQPDSGHVVMWHRSLPQFVNRVTSWLESRGLEA